MASSTASSLIPKRNLSIPLIWDSHYKLVLRNMYLREGETLWERNGNYRGTFVSCFVDRVFVSAYEQFKK